MVDIVNCCTRVDQLNKIFNDLNNIFLSQDTNINVSIKIQFLIDTITTYLTQIITLIREEQVLENLTCTCVICRISITQLTIDIVNSFLLRVTWILCQSIEDNSKLVGSFLILMKQNSLRTTLNNLLNIISSKFSLTLHDYFITLDRYYFTSILINEVLIPTLQNTSSKLTTNSSLHILLVNLHLLSEIKNLKNILILFVTNSTQQCGYRQLLLTIDICIHYIVNVSCKFNPASLERNDTSRIKHGTICMNTLAKEHTRRAMKLRNNNTLSTINHESTIIGHIWDSTKEHILNKCTEILMIRISTIQFHLSLQRYTICKTTLQTLINRIARRVDIVIQELKNEIVTCIGNREVLREHLIQTVILAFLRRSIQL